MDPLPDPKLPEQRFDPRLKAVMAEIKALLRKHDLAGIVHLQSEQHGECLLEPGPTWTCARLDDGLLRVRARLEDYGSTELRDQAIRRTLGMLVSFRDSSERMTAALDHVAECVGRKLIEVKHITLFDDERPSA